MIGLRQRLHVGGRRRTSGIVATAAVLAGTVAVTIAASVAFVDPAAAYTNTTSSRVSGVSCSADNLTSAWGSVTAPANAIRATFTITGGGGAGGDNGGAAGGVGGRGGIVTGTFNVTAGQVVWARVGCGAPDATGNAAGYTTGGNATNLGGGGGGSTAICLNSGAGSCSGGTVYGIAGGGGGGGRSFDGSFPCSDQSGGAGGHANGATASGGQNGGTGRGGTRGGNGGGGSTGGGGGGGIGEGPGWNTGANTPNNTGGTFGRGDGTGDSSSGGNASGVGPGGNGGNGGNSAANDGYWGGGGGGGYTGGGGGGRGDDGNACENEAGAGGGGGSSWASDSTSGQSFTQPSTTTVNCSATNIGTSAGQGGASQVGGCDGDAFVSFTINTVPTGANQSLNATKGTGLGITLAANDAAGEGTPSCTSVSSPSKGSLTGSGCSRTYTASANQFGSDSFTYTVTDADGAVSATYTITLTIVNRAPTGADQTTGTATKGTALGITLGNADLDGDSRTCSIVTSPTKGSVGLSGGSPSTNCTASYTANANTSGNDTFTYRVFDGSAFSAVNHTVTIPIGNRAPTATPQTVNVDAGLSTAITLAGSDLDSDSPLTCAAPAGTGGVSPTKGALGGSGCARTYTSNAGSANAGVGGADSFNFTVNDGFTNSTAATVTVNIANPNLSLAKGHTGRFNPGTGTGTYTLTVGNDTTATANGTTTLVDTLPTGMFYRSFSAGTSGFSCTGTAGVSTTVTCTRSTQIPKSFSGALTITVDVVEGAGSPLTNSAVVSSLYELASTAANNTATDPTTINTRPVANAQTVSTEIDASKLITLTGTDADGDALTFNVVANPAHGSLSGTGATRQYVPDSGYQGLDSFTFTVTDTDALTSTVKTVSIQVGVTKLSGTVTNEVGGAGLAGISVFLVDNSNPAAADPALVATATTNGSGAYDFASQFPTLGAAPNGSYVIRFYDATNNFISEWNVNSASRTGATNVALSSAVASTTINAALTPGARIQGTIRSTAGATPTIAGIQVRLYKIGTAGSKAATSGPGGTYKFELLTAGDYQLWFRDVNSGQWVSEWYDEQTTQAASQTVTLTVGQQRIIDESLAPVVPVPPPTTGTVTGTVRSAGPGNAAIAGIQVRLYSGPTFESSKATTTDANGQYTFTDVVAGSYKLWFRVVQGSAYASEYYVDAADLASATPITVGAGTVVADADLTPPTAPPAANSAVISGTVTELDGFTPIAGLQVRLYVEGVTGGSVATTTDANGEYAFTGRAPGTYQVWFRDLTGTWFSEWNLDKPSQATADPVTAANVTTTTVNASLTAK